MTLAACVASNGYYVNVFHPSHLRLVRLHAPPLKGGRSSAYGVMQLTKFALVLIVIDTQLQLHSPRLRSPNGPPKSLKQREGESLGCVLLSADVGR